VDSVVSIKERQQDKKRKFFLKHFLITNTLGFELAGRWRSVIHVVIETMFIIMLVDYETI
jgi:hypothetical protein